MEALSSIKPKNNSILIKNTKPNCFKCKKQVAKTILFNKPYCKNCYISFLNPISNKRKHNWNTKVNLKINPLKCLICDYVLPVGIDEKDSPDCFDNNIPKTITPLVFKQSTVNEAIHPPKFREYSKRIINNSKPVSKKPKKAKKNVGNVKDSIPDFLR